MRPYEKPSPQECLMHYGILGMKWGVRRFQNEDGTLTSAGKERYYEESSKVIRTNKDGSKTIPKGFVMNRVGKASKDVNQSGALYMSYGKDDAARYVKNLGPSTLGKLLGTAGEAVQHISVKSDLRMPSDKEVATETAKLLASNKKLFDSFKESFYSYAVSTEDITQDTIRKALADPSGKSGQKLAYGVSSFLGDSNYAEEAKIVYKHFREKGYDVIPDLHDQLSGTSKTAMIVINPDKVEVKSYTTITKDIYKEGKAYVKTLEKLPISELIKD